MVKIRVFEAFAGVGTQRMALENIGIKHEVVAISEIDKFAIASYVAIHGKVNNLGDISKIETSEIPDHDLFTYSFPCQDISLAGRKLGLKEGSGTRSSLLWECEKVIDIKRPKYLLMENVKNLIGEKNISDFEKWLSTLEDYGYSNYWQVLNAKNYGIPQNRERVFCVSIYGEHEPYVFPGPITLEKKLSDVLEENVDDRYYLSQKNLEMLLAENTGKFPRRKRFIGNISKSSDVANAVTTAQRTGPVDQYIKERVKIKNATKKGCLEANGGDGIDLSYPKSNTRRGRVQKDIAHILATDDSKGVLVIRGAELGTLAAGNSKKFGSGYIKGLSKTLKANKHDISVTDGFTIRRLTPLECWRLMGIKDEYFYKAKEVNSNTQLYKQAGNAIVVDVLEAIFKKLFLKEDVGLKDASTDFQMDITMLL